MEDKAKIEKCKYSHPHFKNNSIEYHCVVDGWEDDKVRICKKGECESCQKFKSKYIEYPITVHEIENKPIDTSGLGHEEGSLVAYGCESWWKTIRSVDEFSKISNEDINNTWYVKLLQSMDQPEEE